MPTPPSMTIDVYSSERQCSFPCMTAQLDTYPESSHVGGLRYLV